MSLAENKYVLIGAGVALCVALYLAKRGADAVGAGLNAINPVDPNNIINRGAESVYQTVTGSNGTIGGDFYDATHGGRLDVTSGNNAAAASVDWIGGAISGDNNWTLGGAIYDWTH
jgi:hypothetical protein